MPNERISMSKLKQLIGLQSSNLSVRALARDLDPSIAAVSQYLRAVRAEGGGVRAADDAGEGQRASGVPVYAWIHNERRSNATGT